MRGDEMNDGKVWWDMIWLIAVQRQRSEMKRQRVKFRHHDYDAESVWWTCTRQYKKCSIQSPVQTEIMLEIQYETDNKYTNCMNRRWDTAWQRCCQIISNLFCWTSVMPFCIGSIPAETRSWSKSGFRTKFAACTDSDKSEAKKAKTPKGFEENRDSFWFDENAQEKKSRFFWGISKGSTSAAHDEDEFDMLQKAMCLVELVASYRDTINESTFHILLNITSPFHSFFCPTSVLLFRSDCF